MNERYVKSHNNLIMDKTNNDHKKNCIIDIIQYALLYAH